LASEEKARIFAGKNNRAAAFCGGGVTKQARSNAFKRLAASAKPLRRAGCAALQHFILALTTASSACA